MSAQEINPMTYLVTYYGQMTTPGFEPGPSAVQASTVTVQLQRWTMYLLNFLTYLLINLVIISGCTTALSTAVFLWCKSLVPLNTSFGTCQVKISTQQTTYFGWVVRQIELIHIPNP